MPAPRRSLFTSMCPARTTAGCAPVVAIGMALALGAHAQPIPAADPLGPARAALVEGRLADAKVLLAAADAPGLLGTVLERSGDDDGACALYLADRKKNAARAPAVLLRALRCQAKHPKDRAAALATVYELAASPLAADPFVLGTIAAHLVLAPEAPLPADFVARTLAARIPPFDQGSRDLIGAALLVVAQRGDAPQAGRAIERLLVELSETASARVAAALPAAKQRPPEPLAVVLGRAAALAERQDNAAVLAVLTPLPLDVKGPDAGVACEARLLLGKTHRKLRQYAAAKKQLDVVATQCGDDTKKRAAYLAARVAFIQKSGAAATLLRAFADTWPKDALADDVLLWLGEVKEHAGDRAAAESAWRTILGAHPSGDMVHEARFRLAWSRASGGDVDGARALLDEAARNAGTNVHVADRALYWRARLGYAPRLNSLEPTSDAKARADAVRALESFAGARPAGWYGLLARALVIDATKAPASAAPAPLRPLAAAARVTPSKALAADPRFVLARAALDAGYDDEALMLLAGLPSTSGTSGAALTGEDPFVLALLIGRAGAAGAAHVFLRDAGLALLPGMPAKENALAWSIDWPRAHDGAITAAAREHQLPEALLFGLAREESGFDADVVSWAGAVGLCQLMPPTAADEAKAKKLPAPTVSALVEPSLNARLGAAHLARRLRGLKHPALAIAAYNAGPGAVAKWRPTGPVDAWVEQIPVDETRGYVKKVAGSWVTYALLDGGLDDVSVPLRLPE